MSEAHCNPREEAYHAWSHGLGAVGAVLASAYMIHVGWAAGDLWRMLSAAIFGGGLVSVFVSSTVYHALPVGPWKERLQVMDHMAIFLLIAGTYTPFLLVSLDGWLSWTVLAAQWILALVGITIKATFGPLHRQGLQLALKVFMGWMALVLIYPLAMVLSVGGIAWLVAGGLLYSAGVVFYAIDRIPLNHFWWHLFVLGGAACHVQAVASHVLPVS